MTQTINTDDPPRDVRRLSSEVLFHALGLAILARRVPISPPAAARWAADLYAALQTSVPDVVASMEQAVDAPSETSR
jgi:hypothetical protein